MQDPDAPCPKEFPEYYIFMIHLIAAMSVPFNFCSLYLLWTQSPKGSNYKYCLAYLQIVALITEAYMSWLCPGFYFFPMIGGFNMNGYFTDYFDTHTGMSIWLVIFCFELPAIVICFVYRHNAVLEMNRTVDNRRNVKRILLLFCHILPFLTGFNFYKAELTFEQKYMYLKENFPQCLHYLPYRGFGCYDYNQNMWIVAAGVGTLAFVLIFALYAFFLGFQTMLILHKLKRHMSAQTFKMHKTALISLSMQIAIPSILIIIPIYFILMVVYYKIIEFQEMATCSYILISSHSLCASSIMIFTNPRYRALIASKIESTFSKVVRRRAAEISTVRITSMVNTASFTQ